MPETKKKSTKEAQKATTKSKPAVKEEDKATMEQPEPTSRKAKTEGTAAPPEPAE